MRIPQGVLFLAGLIIPIAAIVFLWTQSNVSAQGKLLGSGIMAATFAGPLLARGDSTSLLAQGGFWIAVRAGLALGFYFWAKLSDI